MDFMVWSLAAAMFTTGMLGGLSHCVGMCGPFVLAQVGACANLPGPASELLSVDRKQLRRRLPPRGPCRESQAADAAPATEDGLWLRRARGSMLLPYHLGRITTYAALGALVAAGGGAVTRMTGVSWLLAFILGLAALLFLRQGLAGLFPRLAGGTGGGFAIGLGQRLTAPLRPLFARPIGLNGYLLGLTLGLLPCGLVYAGLASSMGTGDPLAGLIMMAAFGAGTVPALLAIGLLGGAAAHRWRSVAARVTPLLMLVNAFLVGRMAWHMLG